MPNGDFIISPGILSSSNSQTRFLTLFYIIWICHLKAIYDYMNVVIPDKVFANDYYMALVHLLYMASQENLVLWVYSSLQHYILTNFRNFVISIYSHNLSIKANSSNNLTSKILKIWGYFKRFNPGELMTFCMVWSTLKKFYFIFLQIQTEQNSVGIRSGHNDDISSYNGPDLT